MHICSIFSNDEFQNHAHKNNDQIRNKFSHRSHSTIFDEIHVRRFSKNFDQNIKHQKRAKSIDKKFIVRLHYVN